MGFDNVAPGITNIPPLNTPKSPSIDRTEETKESHKKKKLKIIKSTENNVENVVETTGECTAGIIEKRVMKGTNEKKVRFNEGNEVSVQKCEEQHRNSNNKNKKKRKKREITISVDVMVDLLIFIILANS